MKPVSDSISLLYFWMLLLLTGGTACSDLHEEVFSCITENSYTYQAGDATKIVGTCYANLRGLTGFYTYYINEICSDETVQPANDAGWDDGGVYRTMHTHTWNAEQIHVGDFWNCCYTGILLCNRAIEQLNEEKMPLAASENIFVIPFDAIYAEGLELYRATLHAANQATYNLQYTPWGPGSYKAVPQFIDTYDADDQRLKDTWLAGPQYAADGSVLLGSYDMLGEPLVFVNSMPDGIYTGEADGFRWQKYEFEKDSKLFMNNDFVLFRLAQVYMMKAEALLRTGQADEAASIVTLIRQRAFKAHPEKAVVTGAQLQEPSRYVYGTVENYVLTPQGKRYPEQFGRFYDELGWEFAGESFRRRDMIRFGHFTKAEWLSHKPNGDHKVLFPIPQTVVDANPTMQQNPNY